MGWTVPCAVRLGSKACNPRANKILRDYLTRFSIIAVSYQRDRLVRLDMSSSGMVE
jgi:hypothetical protein